MTNRTHSLGLALPAALLGAALAGCVVTAPYEQPVAQAPPVADETVNEQANEPPPPLPDYEQPPCPAEGYVWVPGVWHWGAAGYYWVPGTWVAPPAVGMLWTPGFWGIAAGVYVFHPGHWGTHVGYYGGINYGHGYYGEGYEGGRWVNNRFQYNTAVSNVNITNVHNTYVNNVTINNTRINNSSVSNTNITNTNINNRNSTVNNTTVNNTNVTNNRANSNVTNTNIVNNRFSPDSPQGAVRHGWVGAPGTRAEPTQAEQGAAREPHYAPTPLQVQHHDIARTDPRQGAVRNEGRPPVAGTPHPAAFQEHGVTAAKPSGPAYHAPQQHGGEGRGHEEEPHH